MNRESLVKDISDAAYFKVAYDIAVWIHHGRVSFLKVEHEVSESLPWKKYCKEDQGAVNIKI